MRLVHLSFHSNALPTNDELKTWHYDYKLDNECNITLSLRKTLFVKKCWPYGMCSHYERRRPLNSSSYSECYRKCLRIKYRNTFGCDSVIIDNYISDFDLSFDMKNICSSDIVHGHFRRLNQLENFCNEFCPKDCLRVQYSYDVKNSEIHFDNQKWFNTKTNERVYEYSIIWDTTQPMLSYIDEPVMSFTDYLIQCGGLLGLWFGTNAKDFVLSVYEKNLWQLFKVKFFNYSLILISLIFELIEIICVKIRRMFIGFTSKIKVLILNYIINLEYLNLNLIIGFKYGFSTIKEFCFIIDDPRDLDKEA